MTDSTPTTRKTARQIVFHFGGPTHLAALMERHGIVPRPDLEAVKKWAQRDSIPGRYMLALVELGVRLGKPLTQEDTTDA